MTATRDVCDAEGQAAARGNRPLNLSDFADRAAPNPCKMIRIPPLIGIRLSPSFRSLP
jgi:hypothetical protein